MLVLLSQGEVGFAEVSQQSQAQQLTEKGHTLLQQGQATEALQTWDAATKIYRQLHRDEAIIGSLINQSLALQALGFNSRACSTLSRALELKEGICATPGQLQQNAEQSQQLVRQSLQKQPQLAVRVIGLHNLGDVLRLLGKPAESEIVLKNALAMANRLTPKQSNEIKLSLANTERTLYNQAKNKYQMVEEYGAKRDAILSAKTNAQAALTLYQELAKTTNLPNSTALKAKLNQLSLLLELKQFLVAKVDSELPEAEKFPITPTEKIQTLIKQLLVADFNQLPAIESIYAQLNFVNSLLQISQERGSQLLSLSEKEALELALRRSLSALQVAQGLENERAKSEAYGIIGKIYTRNSQAAKSKQYFEKAMALAQAEQAWEQAYQWQQQLGDLYKLEGNLTKARSAYAAAVTSIEQVRGNLLSVNPDIQFSFKEKIEPVYKEYLRLLLSSPNPDLKQVIRTNEQLQLAELENFLQCGKLNLMSLDEIQVKPTLRPTVIHIINLDDRVEVIVRQSNGSLQRHAPDSQSVNLYVERLLTNLQDENFLYTDLQRILTPSQALYNLIIAPIKAYLPKSGTLVFVLDSSFQGLPMAILHDGNDYLIKRYSISETLSSVLRQPKALPPGKLKALAAGLSQVSPSFNAPNAPKGLKPLPEVETEITSVNKNTASTVELLNEQFTAQRFQAEMSNNDFPLIHISTHGQFSSDPQRTVLLAWDQLIDVGQMSRLLKAKTQGTQDSIELLVLSACQTAKGDKRSALGIAGVAAQAGARSTLASLWLVDEVSTAQLMSAFYQGLKKGVSKAEALRQAQISLLSDPKYFHPYYWSPFILVGSWL